MAMALGVCVTDASLAQTVDLGASTCFQKPPESIHKVDLNPSSFYTLNKPLAGHTYDFRGEKVEKPGTDHLIDIQGTSDGCYVGSTTTGTQARSLTWLQMKKGGYDKGGVHFGNMNKDADVVIDGAHIVNVEDGLMMPRDPTHNSKNITWTLRNSWLDYIRDDAIENDACLDGTVKNVLIDNTHMGFAARPGKSTDTSGMRKATWAVEDTLMHLGCKPDTRTDIYRGVGACPAGESHAQLFKQSACSGTFHMKNVILRVDAIGTSGKSVMGFPPGTYENVTLVWLGAGSYPQPLPPGVTQTKDVAVWNAARAKWLAEHGCNDQTKTCSMLTGGSISSPVGSTGSSTTTTTKTTTQTQGCT